MTELAYVAYGSNLSAERFACYLRGGRPDGATTGYPGCADPTLPDDEPQPITVPHQLAFGRWSPRWQGGVAFLALEPGGRPTLGAAWSITWDQLADLCAQECVQRRADPAARATARALRAAAASGEWRPGESRPLRTEGWYRTAVLLEPVAGRPAVALSGPLGADEHRGPTAAYLRHVRDGLAAVHGLDEVEIDDYLASVLGRSAR